MEENNIIYLYRPYFTLFLVISILFIHLGCVFFHKLVKINDISPYVGWPLQLSIFSECYYDCIDIRYQIWRLFTYSIVHDGSINLLYNLLSLLILGFLLESYIGHLYFFYIYFFSIITAAISIGFFCPYNHIIGSSGGVYGLMGGLFSLSILNFKSLHKYFQILSSIFMIFLITFEICNYEFNRKNNIAYNCHLVGFLYGFNICSCIHKPEIEYKYQIYIKNLGIAFIIVITPLMLYDYITLTTAKDNRYSNKCCFIG